jgi:phosphoribosylaminoimidazolecarboxamide formyltransferase/IMP cyclohydrolase
MLRENGFDVMEVGNFTGSPEILGGRVKTLHPKIYAGILANRGNLSHMDQMNIMSFPLIDIVVCNLYPFEKTTAKPDCTFEQAIEEIDIGGVAMIRAAAKNHQHVVILCNPDQYPEFIERLQAGRFDPEYKKDLAIYAFKKTCNYDKTISAYFEAGGCKENQVGFGKTIEPTLTMNLRYGENPHQKAGLYSFSHDEWTIHQLHGKEISYNNILDMDAAISTILEFDTPASVVIKHLTPCGVALGKDALEAYKMATECDPVSRFGGIVAINRPCDAETATEIMKVMTDIIIAPDYLPGAMEAISKKKNTIAIKYSHGDKPAFALRSTLFGTLVQQADTSVYSDLKVAGETPVSENDLKELVFAMMVAKHVKSNAIVTTKGLVTVGVGAGQPNRVGSAKIALDQAGEKSFGCYLASDGFIPFPDTIELAKQYGVKAIIEPGGSLRDADVIAKADELGIAIVITGQRHFLH